MRRQRTRQGNEWKRRAKERDRGGVDEKVSGNEESRMKGSIEVYWDGHSGRKGMKKDRNKSKEGRKKERKEGSRGKKPRKEGRKEGRKPRKEGS